jgi:hypothetical protein
VVWLTAQKGACRKPWHERRSHHLPARRLHTRLHDVAL